MAFYTWIERIDSEAGTFSAEKDGEARRVTLLAIPNGQPVSIGFVRIEALSVLPATKDGLWLHTIDAEPNPDGTYNVTGHYRPKPPREENWSSYRLATSGETENVKYSLETVAAYGPNNDEVPPSDGVLGWDGDTVHGIDVPVPGCNWIETHHLPQTVVTRPYLGSLILARGHVNSSAWKGFAAGEVMFLDFDASAEVADADTGEYLWTINYVFAARPNETGVNIGNNIIVASKQGWDRIEVRHQLKAEGGRVRPIPTAAYVERVFPRIDFATFGIGS